MGCRPSRPTNWKASKIIRLRQQGFESYCTSLTGVIRTCPKNSIFGIFWIVILERRQPSSVFRTKIYPKIQDFKVVEFLARRFLIERGKNAMNPDGFMSILTKFKWKSSAIKSGSDDFCQAKQLFKIWRSEVKTTIKEIYSNPTPFSEKEVHISGWIRTIRSSNVFGFIEKNKKIW